jgi:hypothetical protein
MPKWNEEWKMRKAIICACLLTMVGTVFAQTPKQTTNADSMPVFWEKFKTAIIKGDKETVAALSAFPISMPYGMTNIKSKAQLLKHYRDIFFSDANAAKCFAKAKPYVDKQRPKEFSIGCKMAAGGEEEPIVYTFTRRRAGWKFTGFDNINE